VERCRAKFKGLRILTGVELGEPHWFPRETAEILAAAPLDRVLGSIHSIRLEGGLLDASQFRIREGIDFQWAVREYFRETLAMVDSGQPFETLSHIHY
jgi:histidinol-phosphatase (PHP family)